MNKPERLPLLKRSVEQLLPLMRPEDYLTVVTYSGEATVVLPPTSAAQRERIMNTINNLRSGGVSDADEGLRLAYEVAQDHFISSGNNRIVLATDGKFELQPRTLKRISKEAERQIFLSVFYFGAQEPKATKELLEQIADTGRGRYCYMQEHNAQQNLLIEAQQVRR
jgi:Ca-activated chloride channel family protein